MRKLFTFLFCMCMILFTAMPIFSAEKVTIELWHAMRGEKKEVIDDLTAKFMKENPDIIVKSKAISTPDLRLYGNNYSCLYRQLIQGLAEGKQPDISQVYENWTTQTDNFYSAYVKLLNDTICVGQTVMLQMINETYTGNVTLEIGNRTYNTTWINVTHRLADVSDLPWGV